MRTLSDTLARMADFRNAPSGVEADGNRLTELRDFAPDPGNLAAKIYVPDSLRANAALVVVLHGCLQTADGYDRGSGWSALADREGFALLFPEQRQANNGNRCFNWFVPSDTRRGQGEVQSIAAMIAAMLGRYPLDAEKVFVTGLSAGGAMTAAMLATYPELFAGGAVIAGLPYASAATMPEAFDRMRGQRSPGDAQLAASVRNAAGDFDGPWPAVSLWHGTADMVVESSNLTRGGAQWRAVHGVAENDGKVERGENWERRVWHGHDGRSVVEEWRIDGLGHGVPIDGRPGTIGKAAPYILASGISSTEHIAASWNIVGIDYRKNEPAPATATRRSAAPKRPRAPGVAPELPPESAMSPVQQIIESALRAAGLMR